MPNVVKEPKKEFLVKWLGYEHKYNTWEPEKHLTHCEDLLANYWANVATSPQGVTREASRAHEETKSSGTRTEPLR
jgi:hypothetical protein